MLPRDDPSYDPEMDRLPPYDPPKRHWYDRLPTDVMVAMVIFLAITFVLTLLSIFFPNPWWLALTFANLGLYWGYLFWYRRR